jgi:hypothetical protein
VIVRLAMWLIAGLAVGVLQVALIVKTVVRVTRVRPSHVRFYVMLSSLSRYSITLLAMTVAIQDSVGACALVGLGVLLARWLLVYWSASGCLVWSRLE